MLIKPFILLIIVTVLLLWIIPFDVFLNILENKVNANLLAMTLLNYSFIEPSKL